VTEFLQFAILGLGLGAAYTLVAQGVVLIYRGSGVVNFAHGTFAMAGGYTFYELEHAGAGFGAALLAAVALGTLLGVATQLLVMGPLRNAAPITRVIATLGIFVALQAAATLKYGDSLEYVDQFLPQHLFAFGGIKIQLDRIELWAIAVALTACLAIVMRRSVVGLATSAAAQNERGVATLGWSPTQLATLNWAVGGALAGLAGALIAPLTGLLVVNLTLLIVPALAAALLGRFDSFWLTLVGATGIGIIQSLCVRYVTQTGAADAIPFLVIILVLVVTGRSLPLRSHVGEKLPSVGTGLIRPLPTILLAVLMGFLLTDVFSTTWVDAFTVSMTIAIILLSVVVVTGFAGQISLAQFAFAGLGAWVAGRLVSAEHWPFWGAALAGLAAAVLFGVLLGAPALRTRGVNLAVVTLGLAVVVQRTIFENVDYTGGISGTQIGFTHLFGLDVNAIFFPDRYGLMVLGALVIVLVGVGNLRRSAAGRRLIAIRTNERAAASLGISVTGGKLYAFGLAATIAALGGILLGFRSTNVVFTNFGALQSIYTIAWTVIGGLGYVLGALVGATFVPGGTASLFNQLLSGIDRWLILISGAIVVLILLGNPDGLIPAHIKQVRWIGRKVGPMFGWARRRRKPATARTEAMLSAAGERERVRPQELEVTGLTVRYGGVVAVHDVTLRVRPGQVVGLIGPNGAGKTSLIDAVTGFTSPAAGKVTLGGQEITRTSAHRRVAAGLVRSWQSLELFEDVTALENLQIASDRRSWSSNLVGLAWPGSPRLSASAAAAVREFQLTEHLEQKPSDLPYGRRRLLGIARSIALDPSVLLLDEPASGLSDTESAELARLVRRLADEWGFAILLVEHDMTFVMSVCDHIVVLDFGRQIADGPPEQIRRDPAVIAAYLGEEHGDATPQPAAAAPPPETAEPAQTPGG
jgi:sulfate-transporting ATPase